MKKFKFIDLFSGIGGFRIALENNGGECVFSSEIDKYARQTYYENFGEIPHGDITRISTNEIPDHDILCAGFPCQPFSLAGNRKGFKDTRGTLFFEIERIIEAKRPRVIILENVSGLVSHDEGKTLKIIEQSLSDLNYSFIWKVLNAKNHGIPQNRNRWYLVGFYKTEIQQNNINFDEIFPREKELKYTIGDIIDTNVGDEFAISEIAEHNIEKHIPEFFNSSRYSGDFFTIANNIRPSKVSFSSNGISPCLTAKMGTGGNNVPVIYELKRKYTVKECLAIMGFPKKYRIKENYSQSYKQVGNSVIVPLIEEIVSICIKHLYYVK